MDLMNYQIIIWLPLYNVLNNWLTYWWKLKDGVVRKYQLIDITPRSWRIHSNFDGFVLCQIDRRTKKSRYKQIITIIIKI